MQLSKKQWVVLLLSVINNKVCIQWGYVNGSNINSFSERALTITFPTSMRDSNFIGTLAITGGVYFAQIGYCLYNRTISNVHCSMYNTGNGTSGSIGLYWIVVG